jgi:translation initiation factor 3 subunit A
LDLYDLLEVQFDPLALCSNASNVLNQLASIEEFVPYLPHLRRVILSRLLSQLSQVYSSLSITYLLKLVAPLNQHLPEDSPDRFDQENIEAFIMSTAKRGELLVRINHSTGGLTFVDDAFMASGASTSASSLQPSPGRLVRTRLSNLAECLYTVVEQLSDGGDTVPVDFKAVYAAMHSERQALQARRSIVARRRELQAELLARKQNEERSQQAELMLRAQEDIQRKKKADALREAQERAKAEMDRKRKEENVKIVSSLLDRGVAIDAVSYGSIISFTLSHSLLVRISLSSTRNDWCSYKWSRWTRRGVS